MALSSFRVTELRRRERDPNLIAAWGFDEPSGLTVRDNSDYNRTLTVDAGMTRVAGHTNGEGFAIQNTGASGAGGAYNANWTLSGNNVTIMGWVRPLDLTSGSIRPLFGIWDAPNTDGSTFFALWAQRGDFGTSNVLQGNVRSGGTLRHVNGSAMTLNTWAHVALSYDGTTIRLYNNGVEVATTGVVGAIYNGLCSFCVAPNSANAQIDDVRVFYRTLTLDEIKGQMNDPVAP